MFNKKYDYQDILIQSESFAHDILKELRTQMIDGKSNDYTEGVLGKMIADFVYFKIIKK